MLGPVLEQAAVDRLGEFALAKVDVDANPELAVRYGIQGIPAVKAYRDAEVVSEFVGAQSAGRVAAFLDDLTGPSAIDRLADELTTSVELPEVVDALEHGRHEHALELLLEAILNAEGEKREQLVRLSVGYFGALGHEHPITVRYRRRLASYIY